MSLVDRYSITKHICPRNCYDACGIIAYSKNGVLQKVEGDPSHPYSKGKLCSKGYSYVEIVYNKDRLKYPIMQDVRGSGNWKRISWEKAIDLIADKILELQQRYHSNLSLCLNKYSGNFGILHQATENFFNGLGPTTRTVGSPCWSAGFDAQYFDFGNCSTSDPVDIVEAKLIVIWGANPAWTAIHSLPFIYKAQENGAKLVVIDPIRTSTAKKADLHIQVNPSGDGALALAIAKIIISKQWVDNNFVDQFTFGWDAFQSYVETLNIEELCQIAGVKLAIVEKLAKMMSKQKNTCFWLGFGLQRHVNGGQNIRAIQALSAMIGAIGEPGGGVQYGSLNTWGFNSYLAVTQNRFIEINLFADKINQFVDPPVKFLWAACRNFLSQDSQPKKTQAALNEMELIVTVEQFLTPTAEQSDIVLPTTTFFEEEDIVSSYWHHVVGFNDKAIEPYFDCKSDLEIAKLLSQALNRKSPNFSSFPEHGTASDFISKEFNDSLHELLGIQDWKELKDSPKKANLPVTAWREKVFETPSKKFEFVSQLAIDNGFSGLAELKPGPIQNPKYPFWLLSTHSQNQLNSQFHNIRWIADENATPYIYIHPTMAEQLQLKNGTTVVIYNDLGELEVKATISRDTPENILLFFQGWYSESKVNINQLIPGYPTDMGMATTKSQGIAYYDAFVAIRKK